MNISLNPDNISGSFYEYLARMGISPKSVKYYRSDLSHFSGWIILKIRSWGVFAESMSEVIPFLSTRIAQEYRSFLTQNSISPKTVNRRLSTLRHLSRFLVLSQISNSDFMEGISNISIGSFQSSSMHPLILGFQQRLEAEKVSKNTIKNYLSDIKHFINWLETNNKPLITNK